MTLSATSTQLDAALDYAARGWAVLPLHNIHGDCCSCGKVECPSPGKHPRTFGGDKDATADEKVIRNWFTLWPDANIGIALAPSGLVVVGPDNPARAAEFERRGLPPTASVQSGGGDGHLHYYYQRSNDCPEHRICKSGEYDILSDGYVVAPPSIHRSGRCYEWITPPSLVADLPGVPTWAVGELTRPAILPDDEDDPDMPPVRLDAISMEWWTGKQTANTDNGVDRSATLYGIACRLVAAGATIPTITAALADRDERLGYNKYTGRSDGGYREYHRIAKKAEAERYGSSDGDSPNLQAGGGGVIRPLLREEWRPPAYLIKSLLNAGEVSMLHATQGAGKSTLTTALAAHVLLGRSFAGMRVRQGPVLWLASEDANGVRSRFAGWCRSEGIEEEDLDRAGLFMAPVQNLLDTEERKKLLDEAHAVEAKQGRAFALVVLDTFAAATPGGDENSVKDTGPILDFLEALADSGAHILFTHHTTKDGATFRGSSRLWDVSTVLSVDSDPPTIKLEVLKQRNGPRRDPLHFQLESTEAGMDVDGDVITLPVVRIVEGDSAPDKLRDSEWLALRCLTEEDGWVSRSGVQQRMAEQSHKKEYPQRTVNSALKGLVEKGLVEVKKQGNANYYRLSEGSPEGSPTASIPDLTFGHPSGPMEMGS